MNIRVTIANEINSHAEQATTKANEAMHHAIEAGKLLLEVKASLAHGQFGEWLETNVKVSPRQAQRYMAAAEGKPTPIRSLSSKYDTVSHLTDESKQAVTDWPVPTWTPTPGHWMFTVWDNAAFWVVPSLEHPGFFHISKFLSDKMELEFYKSNCSPDFDFEGFSKQDGGWDGESMYDGTRNPVRAGVVEQFLIHLGMNEPSKVDWNSREKEGLSRPFGEPDNWTPKPRQWMTLSKGDYTIHVVPSLEHMNLFHVSRVHAGYELDFLNGGLQITNIPNDDKRHYYGTREPVHYNRVGLTLQIQFGIDDPAAEVWSGKGHSGLSMPFGHPDADLQATLKAINARFPSSVF